MKMYSGLVFVIFLQSWSPVISLKMKEYEICKRFSCDNSKKSVRCTNINWNATLESIPRDIPQWTKIYSFDNCHLRAIATRALRIPVPQLEEFILERANLGEVGSDAFVDQTYLQRISLANNELTTLPNGLFHHLRHLQILNLSGNQFVDYGCVDSRNFHPNVNLRDLNLANNKFKKANKVVLPTTTKLNLRGNKLSTCGEGQIIPEGHGSVLEIMVSQLEWLDVSNTRIDLNDEFFQSFNHLKHLNAAGCYLIQHFTKDIEKLSKLEYLNISSCMVSIHVIDKLPRSLQTLDISNLKVSDGNAQYDLELNLTYLDTKNDLIQLVSRGNRMTSISGLENAINLETIDLSNNHINILDLPPTMKKLKSVVLHGNRVSTGSINSKPWLLESLEHLDLSCNQITKLDSRILESLKRLKSLDLSDNPIKELTIPTNSELEVLNLRNGRLKKLEIPQGTPSDHRVSGLQQLILTNNPLFATYDSACRYQIYAQDYEDQDKYVPWPADSLSDSQPEETSKLQCDSWINKLSSCYPKIKNLYLANTSMKIVPLELVTKFEQLKILDLSRNQLESQTIGDLTDSDRICLDVLNISSNMISSISDFRASLEQTPCIKTVDLSHNPMTCSCELAALTPDGKLYTKINHGNYPQGYVCYFNHHKPKQSINEFVKAAGCDVTSTTGIKKKVIFDVTLGILVSSIIIIPLMVHVIKKKIERIRNRKGPCYSRLYVPHRHAIDSPDPV